MAAPRAYHALMHGDHVCRPVSDSGLRRVMAVDFAQQGLWANDRILFLTDDPGPSALRELLIAAVPAAEKAISQGQIVIQAARDVYLRQGAGFDPQATLDTLIAAIEGAVADGYQGLRIDGDLTWLDGTGPDIGALSEYELGGNMPVLTMPVLGMCHYNPSVFEAGHWARIESAHPGHYPDGGALTGIRAIWRDPGVLTLTGTADLANAAAFASLLRAVPQRQSLVVDGSQLEFADAHAMGRLLALSSRQPTTLRVPGAIANYLNLLGAASLPALTLETC